MQGTGRQGRRRSRRQGTALVAAGAGVLAAGVWWGIVAGSGEPEGAAGPPAGSVDVREALDLVPGCTIDTCQVLARRGGFGLAGDDGTLAVVGRPGDCRGLLAAGLHLVGRDGILWSSPGDLVCGDPVAGVETDRTGNAFLAFGASRAPGSSIVIVLRFDGDEVDDFASLDGRYAGPRARVRDLDGDGVFEIVVGDDTWRWHGNGYRRS